MTRLLTKPFGQLAHIPTIGGQDLPLLSLIGSYRFIVDGTAMLQEGYKKVCFIQIALQFLKLKHR